MKQTDYTDEQVERALIAVALNNGSVAPAQKQLTADGLRIPYGTLHRWPQRYHERYQRIQNETLPRVKAELAEIHTQIARKQATLADELADDLRAKKAELPPREISNAMRNASVSAGVHTDKAALLRNEPTHVTETRTYVEVTSKLERLGLIEGEATEKPDKSQRTLEAPKEKVHG